MEAAWNPVLLLPTKKNLTSTVLKFTSVLDFFSWPSVNYEVASDMEQD